jgi:hypothetical protein
MISDNDLLLYHYGDGLDAGERDRIAVALKSQPALLARLQALVQQLDAAAATPELPVPMHIQQRWRTAIERAPGESDAHGGSRAWIFSWRPVAVAAVLIVLVTLGVQLAINTPRVDEPRVADQKSAVPQATERVAMPANEEGGVRWHLASTQHQLSDLQQATGDERAVLITTVIAQNQLYALAAERAGDLRLARALRSFTPILEALSDDGGDPSGSLEQLNFELRVMQARLATPPGDSRNGRTLAL